MNKTIAVNRLCRVEGQGGITLDIKDGKIKKVNMNILEGARFLEPLVVGRKYEEIPEIICRICAICSAVHRITAIQAIERALDIKVSAQTWLLRELLVQGGNIESHALHVFCLAVPDFFKKNSVAELTGSYPDEVATGLFLKKLGNTVQETIGGRAIHPVNALVGGFGKIPDVDTLKDLKQQLKHGLERALQAMELLKTIHIPTYSESPTVYAALRPADNSFNLLGDKIIISGGELLAVEKYRSFTNEFVATHSNAKHSKYKNKSFMVGALARLILNKDILPGRINSLVKDLNMSLPTDNILYNNLAQAVEIVWSLEKSIEICDKLIDQGVREEKIPAIKIKAGTGVGAIEAPRGILFHSYEVDKDGYITAADVITPTAQNCANIEKDLYRTAENLVGKSDEEIKFNLELVVRAYDPCISCSVH